MNKTLVAILILVLVGLGGWYYFGTQPPSQPPTGATQETTNVTPGNAGTPGQTGTYTMAQVAAHASSASCYTAIRGSVYNLTNWIGQHPGGEEAILSICGRDGTDAFVNQHGGMQQQESILATFKIGTLAQ